MNQMSSIFNRNRTHTGVTRDRCMDLRDPSILCNTALLVHVHLHVHPFNCGFWFFRCSKGLQDLYNSDQVHSLS